MAGAEAAKEHHEVDEPRRFIGKKHVRSYTGH